MNAIRTIGMIGVICGVMVTALEVWLGYMAGRGISRVAWGLAIYTLVIAAVWYLGERLFAPTRKVVTRD